MIFLRWAHSRNALRGLVFALLLLVSAGINMRASSQLYRPEASGSAGLLPVRLRCEYADNPLGIDNPRPRLSWELSAADPHARGKRQTAYRILVAGSRDRLRSGRADLWDSGDVSSAQNQSVEYAGRPLQSGQRAYWTVQVWDEQGNAASASRPAWWEMGLLTPGDWKAQWIRHDRPEPTTDAEMFAESPAPLLRGEFNIGKPVKQARAYVTGLGYYELSLNGAKVGDHVLDPGWTAYGTRVPYATYDVTRSLKPGRNAAGIMLGSGWYDPLPLRLFGRFNLRDVLAVGAPCARLQIEITYRDNTRQTFSTDAAWKTSDGPIRKNSVYLGEQYDARREQPGWNSIGFDDSSWKRALPTAGPTGKLTAELSPPIRATRRFSTQKVTQPKPGVFVFDLGTNFAGWARLRVRGAAAGTRITLRYGELMHPDGTLNPMTSVAGQIKGRPVPPGSDAPGTAIQTDVYVCRGQGSEEYTPRFTFHGFRYVEVTGYPGAPPPTAIAGIGLNSDVAKAGDFQCANPLLNRIQEVFENTLLSNVFSVQSDCPHREKLGYGGDIVATSETVMLNFDMARFYEKAVLDLADAVRPNGGFTETAPFVGIADAGLGEGAGPVGWGTAHPQLVWQRYVMYGDRKTLREQLPLVRRWFALLKSKAVDGILDNGISDHESLVPKPTALTGTAFYAYNARLLANIERALGHEQQAKEAEQEAAAIGAAFNRRFLQPGTGRYDTATQACQAIALADGLVPPSELAAARAVLIRDVVETHASHLTTGIFGTPALLSALTDCGRIDVAYKVATQETFPGWGWMLKNGATALWEHWEFSDNTFSHNHPMFGSVSGWFLKSLAGISAEPDAVGFDRIQIWPSIPDGLAWVRGSYNSVQGDVRTEWHKRGEGLTLKVTLPPNTTAQVTVPAANPGDVRESGTDAGAAPGIRFVGMESGGAVYSVGSGEYEFTVRKTRRAGGS